MYQFLITSLSSVSSTLSHSSIQLRYVSKLSAPGMAQDPAGTNPAGSVRLKDEAVSGMLGHESHTLTFRTLDMPEESQDREINRAELIDSYRRFLLGGSRKQNGSRSIRGKDGRFRGAIVEPVQTAWWSLLTSRDRAVNRNFVGEGTGRTFRARQTLPAELAAHTGDQLSALSQELEESRRLLLRYIAVYTTESSQVGGCCLGGSGSPCDGLCGQPS